MKLTKHVATQVLAAMIVLSRAQLASSAPPVIVYTSAADVKRRISADRGHVVLVNMWATWCPGCTNEYSELVRLDRTYRGHGLDVIAVSFDSKSDIRSRVLPFVASQRAHFPQFVVDLDDEDAVINTFDPNWMGGLPRTFVYSRTGKLVKILPNQQSYTVFRHAVNLGLSAK
jgi:thiol-disulfide isomerase/thioredoxin